LAWATARPQVTELNRGVRIDWWITNEPILGLMSDDLPHVDTYFRYEFYVPGAIVMLTWVYPVGTADQLDGREPDLVQPPVSLSFQAITPLADRRARYFYLMGMQRTGSENVLDMALTEKAFSEDRLMIEGQQRNIDSAAGRRFMPTTADHAVLAYARVKERLLGQEQTVQAVRDGDRA